MAHQKTYRKAAAKAEVHRRWKQWLDSQGKELLSVGLPEEILADEDHWTDFCTHGRLHMHPSAIKFTADDIGDAEGRRLLEFLECLLTPDEKPCSALYRRLRERFNPL